MTARPSNIDIRGLLRNSLNGGVSSMHAISELLDNSLTAGSTDIRLTILEKENVLIISDNGCGMNKEELENSGCLHSRTESSADRHGRFGFGGNQAQITLTNLEGSIISLSSDGNITSQLDIDFLKVMESGVYYPYAHDIATRSQPTWDEHAINKLGKGTVIHVHLSQPKQSELIELIQSDAVTGLRFMIGTTYRAQLANGVKISIKMNDVHYQIYPIDRLCSSVPVEYPEYQRETHMIEIMQNKTTDEIVAHVLFDGKRACYKSTKKLTFVSDLSDLECVGHITLTLVYSTKWHELQKYVLDQNGITSLIKGQSGVLKFRELTNGTEIVRNGKVIVALPKPPKGGGDKAAIKYHDDTRSRIEFRANKTMDDVFNIQVNKSKVNVDLIHPNIKKTIENIRYTFSEKCYKASLQTAPTKSAFAGGAPTNQVSLPPPLVRSPSQLIADTESETSELDSVCDSDNESTTDEEVETAIVAMPNEEVAPAIVAMPNEEVAPAIVAMPNEEVESTIVAMPNEEVESTIVAMPVVVPDLTHIVSASRRSYLRRIKGEEILARWLNSGQHLDSFNSILDELHIAYSENCAAKQLRRYLIICTDLTLKCYLLIQLIQERHESPEDHMLKGDELRRTSNAIFGSDNDSD